MKKIQATPTKQGPGTSLEFFSKFPMSVPVFLIWESPLPSLLGRRGLNHLAMTSYFCKIFVTLIKSVLQEALKVLRLIDDKIIYKLNKSIPTDSFVGQVNAEQKCQELYNEVVMLCFLLVFIYLFELIIYLILPL